VIRRRCCCDEDERIKRIMLGLGGENTAVMRSHECCSDKEERMLLW
jgi:hypothetical protein